MNQPNHCSCSECGEIFPVQQIRNTTCPMCRSTIEYQGFSNRGRFGVGEMFRSIYRLISQNSASA